MSKNRFCDVASFKILSFDSTVLFRKFKRQKKEKKFEKSDTPTSKFYITFIL